MPIFTELIMTMASPPGPGSLQKKASMSMRNSGRSYSNKRSLDFFGIRNPLNRLGYSVSSSPVKGSLHLRPPLLSHSGLEDKIYPTLYEVAQRQLKRRKEKTTVLTFNLSDCHNLIYKNGECTLTYCCKDMSFNKPIYFGTTVTITLLYRDSAGDPLSVTLKIK